MTGVAASILEELAMGSAASVLEVLGSHGCGETAVLVCVLFLVVKLSNSSCAVTTGTSSVSEEWGGYKVIPV